MRQAVSRHSAQLGHDTARRRWAGAQASVGLACVGRQAGCAAGKGAR